MKKKTPEAPSVISVSVVGTLLFITTFCWYLLDGGLIEIGGDAIGRWKDLTNLLKHGSLPNWDHHALRWGLNLPVLLFLKISGSSHPALYHLVMPAFGGATAVAIYLTIRRGEYLLSKELGYFSLVLALMVIYPSERPFSQLLPIGAAAFYMMASLLSIKYGLSKSSRRPSLWLFAAGVFCLFAYGTKLTMIWFGLPLGLFVLICFLHDRQYLKIAAFFSPLIFGLIVETVMVSLGTGSSLGRALYVISPESSHPITTFTPTANPGGWGFETFSEYLFQSPLKYLEALGIYSSAIYGALLYIVYCLILGRARPPQGQFEKCLSWTIIGFFLLQSYVVVNFSPYIFPEKYIHARYQYPLLVLCVVFWFYNFSGFFERHTGRQPSFWQASFPIATTMVLGLSFLFFSNSILSRHNNLGVIVTVLHNKILTEWIDLGGNVGYRGEIIGSSGQVEVKNSVHRSSNNGIVPGYIKSIYRRDYCKLSETFLYQDDESVFGLCDKWKPNETVLVYYVTSFEYAQPEGLIYLGKYSEMSN
jgi:hypothetical protein